MSWSEVWVTSRSWDIVRTSVLGTNYLIICWSCIHTHAIVFVAGKEKEQSAENTSQSFWPLLLNALGSDTRPISELLSHTDWQLALFLLLSQIWNSLVVTCWKNSFLWTDFGSELMEYVCSTVREYQIIPDLHLFRTKGIVLEMCAGKLPLVDC